MDKSDYYLRQVEPGFNQHIGANNRAAKDTSKSNIKPEGDYSSFSDGSVRVVNAFSPSVSDQKMADVPYRVKYSPHPDLIVDVLTTEEKDDGTSGNDELLSERVDMQNIKP